MGDCYPLYQCSSGVPCIAQLQHSRLKINQGTSHRGLHKTFSIESQKDDSKGEVEPAPGKGTEQSN
jgi:hypothetical protein